METTIIRTCFSCGRNFFYAVRGGRGRPRSYCDDCAKKVADGKTRDRKRAERARKAASANVSPVRVSGGGGESLREGGRGQSPPLSTLADDSAVITEFRAFVIATMLAAYRHEQSVLRAYN